MVMLLIAYLSIWSYKGHVSYSRKTIVIYFINMQPRKTKFTFVQINMKQVLYKKSSETMKPIAFIYIM